jgi:hypothetical protein
MVFGRSSDAPLNNSSMSSADNSGIHSGLRRPTTRGNQGGRNQGARNQGANRPSSLNFMGLSVSRNNRYLPSTGGGLRNSTRRLADGNDVGGNQTNNVVRPRATYRRYRVGDNVLVCCNSHWAPLVNRYGFPPGDGTTAEEQSGPYSYVMATVRQVHFDEFAEYYTVKRADNGAEQRADTGGWVADNVLFSYFIPAKLYLLLVRLHGTI